MNTKRNHIIFELLLTISLLLFVVAVIGLAINTIEKYNAIYDQCVRFARTPHEVVLCR